MKATDTTSGVYGQLTMSWTCLPLKTLITMANNTQKQMGEIEVGEMVKAIDPVTKEFSNEKVTFVLQSSKSHDLIQITCEDSVILRPTPEHEVWIRRGNESLWSNAIDLKVGDEMLADDLQYKKILSVEPVNYPEGVEVGNISVANAKVYFAEHLLMHNTGA
jgi:intein/homing endonuclease